MARTSLTACWLVLAALLATPAFAQSIFDDFPPRPPADVPNAPPRRRRSIIPIQPPAVSRATISAQPARRRPRRSAAAATVAGADEPAAGEPPRRRHHPVAAAGAAARHRAGAAGGGAAAGPAAARRRRSGADAARSAARHQAAARAPPPQQANAAPQPGDEIVVEPPPQRITNPTAVFSGLDKITGRIISFDVAINETVQFGALQVTPRVCYSRPPTETPNTDAFVEVDEVTLQGEIKRIFTGWMFAASPGLHAVEHPIYDVWLTDCKGGKNPNVAEAPPDQPPPPKQPVRAPPRRPPPPRTQQPGFIR